MEGLQGKKTIRIQGLINKQEVLILIDSGSSSTFISNAAAQRLGFEQQQAPGVTVTVADGGALKNNTIIPAVTWWTQGHTFSVAARVLDITCYDMVLGMDWLEQHSPMWIHWKRKKLRFTYKGQRITLTGVKDCTASCYKLKTRKLGGLIRKGGVSKLVQLSPISHSTPEHTIPDLIQTLIEEHAALFQEPTELPPSRTFDHQINLIPGVKPVNVKPYRYSPFQKEEIECQVKDMLIRGVIQPSTSPFSSPVLLVKKKDGTWH